MSKSILIPGICLLIAFSIGPGCGGGTGTGNPKSYDISLASSAYNTSTAAFFGALSSPDLVPSAASVNQFKFCIREIKFESSPVEVKLGLIDLGDGSNLITWGKATPPSGKSIKKIEVVIHKDKELCGVDYSMNVNGQSITKDLQLKFAFSDDKTFGGGETVTFSLATLISKLTEADSDGNVNDDMISDYLDGSFEDEAKSD
jgi:hypothetical protein